MLALVKPAALACLVALLVCAAAGGATARHVVETATNANVEATFSYDYDARKFEFSNVHLTIRRGGAVLVDGPVRPLASYAAVDPAPMGNRKKAIDVRNLDRDPEPEVVLDLYSGGAHCCWYTEVFRYIASANTYLMLVHSWGNATYRPADLNHDGLREFVSADDRFAYEFTAFAGSTFPVQIWRYRLGMFVGVTRKFPRVIRRDARRQWHWALDTNTRRLNVGSLASWTADECLLRHCRFAFRRLEVLRREHRIGRGWDATPRKFLRHLRRFLRRTGYLR
jgi:hypothetical protein